MNDRMDRKSQDESLVSLAACACHNIRRTARAVTQAYDTALRPSGLKTTQFSLLARLHGRDPVMVTRLAEWLDLDRTTLTRNLKPLEKRGLLRITPGRDARMHEISLSEKGAAAFQAALPMWKEAQKTLAESLGGERLRRLLGDLSAVRENALAH